MRALRLFGVNELRVEEVEDPSELGPRQLLVRTRFCGICGTDLHEYADGPKLATVEAHVLTGASLPQILGHEFSGEVRAVGREVRSAKVGDRISVMPLFFCGDCSACQSGRQQCCIKLGAVGLNWPWGGMGQYAVVEEHQAFRLPEEMSDVQGALVEPTAVALHAVTSAPVRPGDVVLVTGGGPIGQLVALAANAAGAGAVYLSEPNPHRRERVAKLGLAGVLDPTSTDVVADLRNDFPGGVDLALECAGSQRALDACIDAVRPGATIVQTALHTRPVEIEPTKLTLRDVAIKGVNCFPVTSWPRVIRLIASGAIPAERVVTREVPLDRAIEDGFKALLDPSSDHIKVLVAA